MTTKPDAPKRPLNATFKYNMEHMEQYRKDNPTKKITEVTTELSAKYKSLPEKDKQKYIDAFNKENEAYKKVND